MNGHLYSFQGHEGQENCAVFSPCGRFIISGSRGDNSLKTWVNWKMLCEDNLLQDGGDWAAKQYAGVNHDGASIEGSVASAFRG